MDIFHVRMVGRVVRTWKKASTLGEALDYEQHVAGGSGDVQLVVGDPGYVQHVQETLTMCSTFWESLTMCGTSRDTLDNAQHDLASRGTLDQGVTRIRRSGTTDDWTVDTRRSRQHLLAKSASAARTRGPWQPAARAVGRSWRRSLEPPGTRGP